MLGGRKGFVRLALATGASLVPVYGLGNCNTYQTYSWLAGLRNTLAKRFGIALPKNEPT